MTEQITKRLHISGLTSGLTVGDISTRLGTFGTVKALDGFNLLDGVGQPRKFAYVSLETTQGQLSRCMNLLSGSTWKGAKLRIGEAKPDFAQRSEKERSETVEPPKKKRRYSKYTAVHAEDMSLVTPENLDQHPGWKTTQSGKLMHSMRMRPERPLPPTLADLTTTKGEKKPKKRNKTPDVRARRVKIDMTQWPGERLQGVFLENFAPSLSVTVPDIDDHNMPDPPIEEDITEEETTAVVAEKTTSQPKVKHNNKLKDLFAPQEGEGGFSLLGHLDLDLDLDETTDPFASHNDTLPPAYVPTPITAVPLTEAITFDPGKPFFFPSTRGGTRDIVELMRMKSQNFKFCRSETDDQIHQRWEDSKVELTQSWKKRWREAGKVRKRRGGADDDIE